MKRIVALVLLAVCAAGCARSGEVVREGFIYADRDNELTFRRMTQVVHTVWEHGGRQFDVKHYREAWRVRLIGPVIPGADDVILTNRLTHDSKKVDYKGRDGRSDRFTIRLADTKDLGVDVGRNDIDYTIVDDEERELDSGTFIIDVMEVERRLPDRTVFIEEPDYYFHFGYNYYHHPHYKHHHRRW